MSMLLSGAQKQRLLRWGGLACLCRKFVIFLGCKNRKSLHEKEFKIFGIFEDSRIVQSDLCRNYITHGSIQIYEIFLTGFKEKAGFLSAKCEKNKKEERDISNGFIKVTE
jgi:hypothetical protein